MGWACRFNEVCTSYLTENIGFIASNRVGFIPLPDDGAVVIFGNIVGLTQIRSWKTSDVKYTLFKSERCEVLSNW